MVHLTPGNGSDVTTAPEVLVALSGRLKRLVADRGYDANHLRRDLKAGEYDERRSGLWTRGLLIRCSLTDGELAFFSTWCPAGTPISTLVAGEERRWGH